MSASFMIPLSALFDEDGDSLVRWKAEQVFCPDHRYDFADKPYVHRMQTSTVHSISVRDEWFEVHLILRKDTDGSEVLDAVSFSGFHGTCVHLQSLLEISVEIH